MLRWKLSLAVFTFGALPLVSAAADCPNPFPETPSKADFKACFTDIAEMRSEIATLRTQIRALEDSLLGPNKPETSISVSGANMSAANCPDGYFLTGLRASQVSGGKFAAQSIVVIEAVCKRLLPQ